MVDVDDLDLFFQSVDRDGDRFRDVGSDDDEVSDASLHGWSKQCQPSRTSPLLLPVLQ